jgi:uncharacterized protein YcbK (DUF882 family)
LVVVCDREVEYGCKPCTASDPVRYQHRYCRQCCESCRCEVEPGANVRSVSFDNLHTGQRLSADYWADGDYIPDALKTIDHVLRDFRTGDVHPIEPRLLDLLALLRAKLETESAVRVISGYRSPKTNAMLHEKSDGVASSSLHMEGMAIDIRIGGRQLAKVRDAALTLAAGGVGYYPRSDFVHVDVGRVRRW